MENHAALDVTFGPDLLGQLMPLYVHIAADGIIRSVGPTMARLFAPEDPAGMRFLDLFALRRPFSVQSLSALSDCAGQRLHLQLRRPPGTAFRGQVLNLAAGPAGGVEGLFVNLSFGLTVSSAVRAHGLTEEAFAPTDLAIEMLYLTEAKTAVMRELHNLASRLHHAKTEAEDQALTDPLTGLRNRRALEARLLDADNARMPFGLMQIDLDRFKAVNDTLGHAAGDHVLRHVGEILITETRQVDTVARIGGDEFVILFPGLTRVATLTRIAGRILDRIRQPISYRGTPCAVSASIGVTTSGRRGEGSVPGETLLMRVDRALYASKENGRGCVTVLDTAA